MKFSIRQEVKSDYSEIYNLIKTAFETADVKDGDEQDYASELRNKESFIPQLALVAVTDNKLIGQIMFTRTYITKPDGAHIPALLLSPLSVLIEYRNKGVGAALINTGIEKAKIMGYRIIFLCGDPDYYSKFGFVSIANYKIESLNNIPVEYILVYEIIPNSLSEATGSINIC